MDIFSDQRNPDNERKHGSPVHHFLFFTKDDSTNCIASAPKLPIHTVLICGTRRLDVFEVMFHNSTGISIIALAFLCRLRMELERT